VEATSIARDGVLDLLIAFPPLFRIVQSPLEVPRDIAIILLALLNIVLIAIMVILVWQLWRLMRLITKSVPPLVNTVQETANTVKDTATSVKGTVAFVDAAVVRPTIEAAGFTAGAKRFVRVLFRGPRRRGGSA
jgi:predicted PurR-regulated permease PerM